MKELKNRGITLIALIITIIVLLILVGVSISMVVGDNGILSQAVNASVATDIADTKEQIELALIGYYDEDGWTIAYTCTDGVWSDAIEAGEIAEGDIVAKFYATENTITPPDLYWRDTDTTYTVSEGTEYYLVIEGKGSMPELMENDEYSLTAAYAWHVETAMFMLGYANICIMPYVTEITYKGTKADWEEIEKAVSWRNYSNITKIICTDGEITL